MNVAFPRPASAIRVLVVDDSSFMRKLLERALASSGFRVVGTAADGDEALRQCAALRPDVMTLDLAMPGLDGIAVLRRLQTLRLPVSVVVVSAFSPAAGARAIDALAEGAVEIISKPDAGHSLQAFEQTLTQTVSAAATSRPTAGLPRARRPRRVSGGRPALDGRLVVIASSTGGPRALATFIPALPPRLGAGALLIQHMPPGFTGSLATRLDRSSQVTVREAVGGEELAGDTIYVAPGGAHLRLTADRRTALSDAPPVGALRPRADLTIQDAVKLYGSRVLLVVLTGMGRDGLDGARAVRNAGGRILAEAEETCTVYGMPRAVAEAGLVDVVAPIDELADAVCEEVGA